MRAKRQTRQPAVADIGVYTGLERFEILATMECVFE